MSLSAHPLSNHTSAQFCIKKAYLFARLSKAAYILFERDSSGEEELKKFLLDLGLTLVAPINAADGTAGFVARNSEFAVICFRGTETDTQLDIMINAAIRIKDEGHQGFFGAFESVRLQVMQACSSLDGVPVYVTGHSLGGALANVAVLVMGHTKITASYTFGAPAICTLERSKTNQVPCYLFINEGDIVPRSLTVGSWIAILGMLLFGLLSMALKNRFSKFVRYLYILTQELMKYHHFGDLYALQTDGQYLKLADHNSSVSDFLKIVVVNYRRSISDHSIDKYVHKLENSTEYNVVAILAREEK